MSFQIARYFARSMRFPAAVCLLSTAMSAAWSTRMEAQQLTPVLVPQTVAGNGTAANKGANGPAIAASLNLPNGIVVDALGNYYVSESTGEVVVKVSAGTGIMTIVAGNGTAGHSGDGGLATAAELNNPSGLAIDNNGNLLIADDNNNAVRAVNLTTGIITNFAGNNATTDSGNGGPATSAGVDQPFGLACDRSGNTYIVEVGGKALRMVNAAGIISTIAGNGHEGDGGNGGKDTSATVYKPYGGWMDAYNNLFFSEPDSYYVRTINPSGIMNLVSGTGTAGRTGNGGPANVAELDAPRGLGGDNFGNLFIAENGDIREINSSGIINMIAGTGTAGSTGDGGPAKVATFSSGPYLALDSSNNIYVSDGSNERVRRLSLNTGLPATPVGATAAQNLLVESSAAVTPKTAVITSGTPAEFTLGTLAGCTLGSSLAASTACTAPITFTPTAPGLQSAPLAFTDASGNVSPIGLTGVGIAPTIGYGTGNITTVAGNGTAGNTGAGGAATAAELSAPRGGVIDSAGNIFFADSGNNVIRRIDAVTGKITTIVGNGTAGYTGDGAAATAAELNAPAKVVVNAAGDLYIADMGNNVIRYVSAATGFISTIAGNGTSGYTGDNAAATSAELNHPQGLAVDLGGHVYVADTGNNVIRYFGPGWYITTLYGNGTAGFAGDGGTAYSNTVELNAPTAIAFDLNNDLYIADSGNDIIRVVTQPTNQISTFAGQQGNATNAGDGSPAIAATLNTPSDIAIDAAGDVYIAASGQVRLVNGNGTISTIAGTGATGTYSGEGGIATSAVIPAPASNLMTDNSGNVVISATAANLLLKVASATAPVLNMGTTTPGTTSVAQLVTILNTGNSTLNFSGVTASTNFTVQSSNSTDCAATTSLAPGQTCSLEIAFSPDISANGPISGTVTLTDNALNGTNATQTIALSGIAKLVVTTTTSVSISPASPLVYGTPASITATVSNGNAATGTVSFAVNGVPAGSATLSNNQAIVALPSLPVGTASINASYSGDNNNGSSSGKTSVTIQTAVLTVTAADATLPSDATALPPLTYNITGFVNGDPGSIVSGTPTETTTATPTSAIGTYPITITQGTLAAPNYTFHFVNGTLTIPGPNFTLNVTPPTVTVIAGTMGLATLTLTPLYKYSGTVSLSCGSLPANISCAFTGPLAGNAQDTPTWTQVQIYTSGGKAKTTTSSNNFPFSAPRMFLAMGMPLCFFGIALFRGRRAWTGRLLGLLLLAVMTIGMSSCSGNSGSAVAAPTGTYQLSITATDTSANLSHTAMFTLVIQ